MAWLQGPSRLGRFSRHPFASLASLARPTSRDRLRPASARSPRPTSTCRPIDTRDAGPHPRRAASRPVTSRSSLRHVTAARRALASGWEAPPRPLTGRAPRRGGSRAPGPPARELAHGSVGGCLRKGSEASGARDLAASFERLRRAAEPARPWRRALSRRRTRCFISSPAGETRARAVLSSAPALPHTPTRHGPG